MMAQEDKAQASDPPFCKKPLPRPIRQYHTLPDGRLLSYCTFTNSPATTTAPPQKKDEKDVLPLLYLHGFPGCGNEGALCAAAAVERGCQVFAIDRPGFGFSQPLPEMDCETRDTWMKAVLRDLWHFVTYSRGWDRFGLIGVSGGGPYALGLLETYLNEVVSSKEEGGIESYKGVRLEGVALVAGVNCSAGTEGMMKINQQLYKICSQPDGTIWGTLSWYLLLFQMNLQRLLIRLLHEKWLFSSSSAMTKYLPKVDQDLLQDETIQATFGEDVKLALRQSATPAVYEARALFRGEQPYERSLTQKWMHLQDGHALKPKVMICQGLLDVNVPASHSKFVFEKLLGGGREGESSRSSVRLIEYPDMGHLSLVIHHAKDYIAGAKGEING